MKKGTCLLRLSAPILVLALLNPANAGISMDINYEPLFDGYGFSNLLFSWDEKEITGTHCMPLPSKNSGYFCDAVQFSIFFQKYYKGFRERANIFASNSGAKEMDFYSITSLSELGEKTGMDADFNALLLKDNYSEQFKEDFDLVYGKGPFGKNLESLKLVEFGASPEESGLFRVELEASVSFDGEEFVFPEAVRLEFVPLKSIEELDEENETELVKNPFFSLPFDATIGTGQRDYGTGISGKGIWLNQGVEFAGVSGGITEIEFYPGQTFDETKTGHVFSIEKNGNGEPEVFYLTKSIPLALIINPLPRERMRLYYSLGNRLGQPFSTFFYGEEEYLFEWKSGKNRQFDYFSMLSPKTIACSGWSDEALAAVAEFLPEGGGELFHTISFFPENTVFLLECVSEALLVSMHSFDGNSFGHRRIVSGEPGSWLAGQPNMLFPREWKGHFSLGGLAKDVNAGRAKIIESGEKFSFYWNKEHFEKLLEEKGLLEGSAWEKGPTKGPEEPLIEEPETKRGTAPEESGEPEPEETPEKVQVENYVVEEEPDADNDGFPDSADSCPLEPENFNGYLDADGCADELEPPESGPENGASIAGKKAILFVPLGFSEKENSEFQQLSKKRFDSFLEKAGLNKEKDSISFIAMNVEDAQKIAGCVDAQPDEWGIYLGFNSTSIAFDSLEACANDYFAEKYGIVPAKESQRVVGLLNTRFDIWYYSLIFRVFCAGLTEISRSGNSHLVFAMLSEGTVEHELGHTFGLEDQYSSKIYIKNVEWAKRIPPNYYPGPLQAYFDLESMGASILYSKYPQGTKEYPLCTTEPRTNCPEVDEAGEVDCYGRKLESAGSVEKRSVMGPVNEEVEVGFDCYEKECIQGKWAK